MLETTGVSDVRFAIIGTGFSGLGAALKLKQEGHTSFLLFEREQSLGGTWRDNVYPGCACDVPSHLYCFSFAPGTGWNSSYAGQGEILAYLQEVVESAGIASHIRFGSMVTEARYQPAEKNWKLSIESSHGSETITAQFLLAGPGPLRVPRYPDIPGLGSFSGPCFHSARWDAAVELEGKTVAVVGTGASSIQIVPEIAQTASRVLLFQRTPTWVSPRLNRHIGKWEQLLYRKFPILGRVRRLLEFVAQELLILPFALLPPSLYVVELFLNRWRKLYFREHPDLERRLKPNYRAGCKRIVLSSSFYRALKLPNVTLVDRALKMVKGPSLTAEGGEVYSADVLILCTGFEVSQFLSPLKIFGEDGVDISEHWSRGASAFMGSLVAGFPNLFLLLGPNTGLGHNSLVFMVECQVDFFLRCLRATQDRGGSCFSVSREVQTRFNLELQSRLKRGVWSTGGCSSWYLDSDGINRTLWPGSTLEFWWKCRRAAESLTIG